MSQTRNGHEATQPPRGEAPPPRDAPPPASTPPGDTPPKNEWLQLGRWVKERPWPVLLFAGLLLLASVAWMDLCVQDCKSGFLVAWANISLPLITLAWIALLFAWFIDCFTGDPYERRTKAIEFAYFFMVLSFCLVAIMIADMGKARKFGVVEGCVENLTPTVFPIQCDLPKRLPPSAQAGVSTAPVVTGAAAGSAGETKPRPAATTGGSTESQQAGAIANAKSEKKTDQKSEGKKDGKSEDKKARPADNANPSPAQPEDVKNKREADALTFPARKANYIDNRNYHYLLNIGGHLDPLEPLKPDCAKCENPMFAVRGGLPVPVYFIVLALIGGAISLAKNVPGIQKRSDEGWQGTATEPRLTPGEVRELLLFQVLQFVSAPLLAVAAYHTIKPESLGSTVALGFLVGFGSDQILASIRSMVKGTQGAAAATPVATSIHGTIMRAGVPVSNATIVLDGTTLTTRSDAKGEFLLLAVPVRPQPYVLKVTAADKTKQLDVKAIDPAPVKLGTIDLS